jgi:hypothetical protein
MGIASEKNIYGQKQGGRVWNLYLIDKLVNEIGFTQSRHDECVFYRGNVIYRIPTIRFLAGPDEDELNDVEDIKAAGLDVTDEGDIEDFLGVNIEKIDDDTYHLSAAPPDRSNHSGPPGSGLNNRTPASSTNVINAYTSSEPFDEHFHYRSVIGKLTEKLKTRHILRSAHVRQVLIQPQDGAWTSSQVDRKVVTSKETNAIIRPQDESFVIWADADL